LTGSVLRVLPDTGEAAPGNPFIGDANADEQKVVASGCATRSA
jgi:hypothetical protein